MDRAGARAFREVLRVLALARTHIGQVDEAVNSLHRSIDTIDETRGFDLNVAFAAARVLPRWRGDGAVEKIYDPRLALMVG